MLRKSESDIRNHIKIEHQMKIYSDSLKAKIEELEKSKAEYKKNYLALQEKFNKLNINSIINNNIQTTNNNLNPTEFHDKKEKEIKHLTNEIANLKVILGSYENQNNKITDLEMKLRNQQINFDKKLKNYEIKYKEQITILNNIIANYEEVLETRKSISVGKENTNNGNNKKNSNNNNKRFFREFNDDISTLTINEENSFEYQNTERSNSSNRVSYNSNNEKLEIDECSNLTKKIEHYKNQIEKKLEKFNLKKIMNTSTTDTHSRDNISEITSVNKVDNKQFKVPKIGKFDGNSKYTEGNTSIPIFNIIQDEYENSDKIESLSNRRFSKNKVASSSDLNKKLNNKIFTTQRNNCLFTEDGNKDKINDYLLNKIYKKRNSYQKLNDDEQYDLNLREIIYNKMKKNAKKAIIPGHQRSNSTNIYNY